PAIGSLLRPSSSAAILATFVSQVMGQHQRGVPFEHGDLLAHQSVQTISTAQTLGYAATTCAACASYRPVSSCGLELSSICDTSLIARCSILCSPSQVPPLVAATSPAKASFHRLTKPHYSLVAISNSWHSCP